MKKAMKDPLLVVLASIREYLRDIFSKNRLVSQV